MRKSLLASGSLVLLGIFVCASASFGQGGNGQVASPPAKAECKLADGKKVEVDYSSPRMRGRAVFGSLVPYGEPWRAGANEATTFVIDAPMVVGGKDVPAGNYTVFALPNKDAWTLIVSKQTGEWGIPYPGESYDLTRAPMKVSKLSSPLENFTITFDQAGLVCTMRLAWETTSASIDIVEKK
jgi:hypothetical protein